MLGKNTNYLLIILEQYTIDIKKNRLHSQNAIMDLK